MDFSDRYIDEFGKVAGLASIYELRLRLFADQVPELKEFSHAKKLEELEDQLIAKFDKYLTPEVVALLRTGRQLRNKLLHGDFSVAAQKVEQIKPGALADGGVRAVNLKDGSVKRVNQESSKIIGIFGWLLEAGVSGGLFDQCRDIFSKMIAMICTIRDEVQKAGQ